MSFKASKRLVIDADVARAAGGKDAKYPKPKHCRDFLEAVRVICHRGAILYADCLRILLYGQPICILFLFGVRPNPELHCR